MHTALPAFTERIRKAAAQATPLRIRGGGSKDFYGGPLAGEPLDTGALQGILAYEPSELYIRALAGTPLAELEALLAERQQCLPFEPPHFAGSGISTATVGGMVAAGLSGPARAAAGAARDYVLGLSLIDGRGDHQSFGGQVMKNVAGYDIARLVAGSLGILGLITEVSLKVLPLPAAEATLQFTLAEAEAIARLNHWAGQPLPLNASCWHAGVLSVRLRGAQAAVQTACTRMGGTLLPDAAAFWATLREQTHPFFAPQPDQVLLRLALPDTVPPLQAGPTLVEWGGAQRWLQIAPDQVQKVRLASAEYGGHATIFRANELSSHTVFTPPSPVVARIHRGLKQQFDPAGIFNPGRLYPDL